MVGSKNDILTVIDFEKQVMTKKVPFQLEINEFSFDRDGKYLFFTTGTGAITIYSYPELLQVHSVQAHFSNCYCIDFDQNRNFFYVGSGDAMASMWSIKEMACIKTFSNLE